MSKGTVEVLGRDAGGRGARPAGSAVGGCQGRLNLRPWPSLPPSGSGELGRPWLTGQWMGTETTPAPQQVSRFGPSVHQQDKKQRTTSALPLWAEPGRLGWRGSRDCIGPGPSRPCEF